MAEMYRLDQRQIDDITNYIFLEDEMEEADIIFIPGCARPDHTEEAARLYAAGYAPYVLPSGGFSKAQGEFLGVKSGQERYGSHFSCEADFLAEVLMQNGVPEEAILKEREATYTLQNAQLSKILLEERGIEVKTAILCCKAYHARRSYLYYSMVFPEVRILVHPYPIDGITRENWYKTKEGREIVLGEVSRMGQQLLMMEGRIAYPI